MIQIGDVLQLTPVVCLDKNGKATRKILGTVVYINEEHRYFTAEFVFPETKGRFRESFKFILNSDKAVKPYNSSGAQFHRVRGAEIWSRH